MCRRLMPWLREVGLEFVDIIVTSDTDSALTSMIESWSKVRAMKSGRPSRPVGHFEEQRDRREPSVGAGNGQTITESD